MAKHRTEWIDGFLFVGNHPALDLLNTRLVNAQGPVELLPDAHALARWLNAVGVGGSMEGSFAVPGWADTEAAGHFLQEVVVFREDLRSAVVRLESGRGLGRAFLEGLNRKLLAYPHRYVLSVRGGVVRRRTYLEQTRPEDLWREFAAFAAELFTDLPPARVRRCEGCVVHFYDISKKGSRRWCSMQMCGNRDKVATYRQKLGKPASGRDG